MAQIREQHVTVSVDIIMSKILDGDDDTPFDPSNVIQALLDADGGLIDASNIIVTCNFIDEKPAWANNETEDGGEERINWSAEVAENQ